jgi:hypothetical protein
VAVPRAPCPEAGALVRSEAEEILLGGALVSAIGVAATFLAISIRYALVVGYGFVNPAFRRMDERRGSTTAAPPSATRSEPAQ